MGMGGMGMGMGMGGGQSSTMMVSSAMGASVCLSLLAAGGYYYMNKTASASDVAASDSGVDSGIIESTDTPAPSSSTTAVTPSNLDGVRLITVGSLSMRVEGKCGNGIISFREAKNDKWSWNVKKVGTTSDGLPYYTLESFDKIFGKGCAKRYLTAPSGCKGPPYLAGPQFGPLQYWIITGTDATGYQIENLACRQMRTKSFLIQAGQKKMKRPNFSARSGSTFSFSAPYTG